MDKREVYLDYAASTPLYKECIDAMSYAITSLSGDSSSFHYSGRKSSVVIEQSRRTIAEVLHCSAKNIIFTSGATEAINLGIWNICKTYKPTAIITSKTEYLATLKAIEESSILLSIPVIYVQHTNKGHIDLSDLNTKLSTHPSSLLCLMHANNEIGNLLPVKEVGKLCKKYHTLFFCDMAQTIGKYNVSLSQLSVDFAVASAHKFYGPKATGLLYYTHEISPLLLGEHQERNMRAGMENIYGILGMEKALQKNMDDLETIQKSIFKIKSYCIEQLMMFFDNIVFVGDCKENGLYNLLNFYFPDTDMDIIAMHLDMAGIAVSLSNGYSNGLEQQNHVLSALNIKSKSLRLSFGINTTIEDIDYFIQTLSGIQIKNKCL